MVRIALLFLYFFTISKLTSSNLSIIDDIDNDTNSISNSSDIDLDQMTNAALIGLLEDRGFDFGEEVDINTRHKLIAYTKEVLTNESLRTNYKANHKQNVDNSNDDKIYDEDNDEEDVDDIEIIEVSRKINSDSIHESEVTFNENISSSSSNNSGTTNDINSLARRELPDNATVWEILKEQIRSDLAPFLILIPGPIKRYISIQFIQLIHTIKIASIGALQPLTKPLSKVIMLLGKSLIQLARHLDVSQLPNSTYDIATNDVIHSSTSNNLAVTTLSMVDSSNINNDDDEVIEIIL